MNQRSVEDTVLYRSLRVGPAVATKAKRSRVSYTLVTITDIPSVIAENLTARELIAWLASRGFLPSGSACELAVLQRLRVHSVRVPVL